LAVPQAEPDWKISPTPGMMTSVSGFQPANSTDSPAIPAVAVDRRADAVVLTVTGEVDMTTAPELEHAVRDALAERPAALVIDLTAAEFLSSAGIAVLVFAHRNGDGVAVRVVAAERIVLRPLELTGLSEDLAIYPTLDAALAG
jgi:anti-anti-sigma factor